VEEIVVTPRAMCRVLALLPAAAVALGVRLLTLTAPPLAVRAAAAGGVAAAAWLVYRLLTARIVVDEPGVHIRGVFYEADIPWAELNAVDVAESAWPVRWLVWGLIQPHTLSLRTSARTLRPVAAVSHVDDEELSRAIDAMRARMSAHFGATSTP
jgi:hypothetical protein